MNPLLDSSDTLGFEVDTDSGTSKNEKTELMRELQLASLTPDEIKELRLLLAARGLKKDKSDLVESLDMSLQATLGTQASTVDGYFQTNEKHDLSPLAVGEQPVSLSVEYKGNVQGPNIQQWSVEDVIQWLHSIDLSRYSEKFRQLQINGNALLLMNSDDDLSLLEIDVRLHRRKLLREVVRLRILQSEKDEAGIKLSGNSSSVGINLTATTVADAIIHVTSSNSENNRHQNKLLENSSNKVDKESIDDRGQSQKSQVKQLGLGLPQSQSTNSSSTLSQNYNKRSRVAAAARYAMTSTSQASKGKMSLAQRRSQHTSYNRKDCKVMKSKRSNTQQIRNSLGTEFSKSHLPNTTPLPRDANILTMTPTRSTSPSLSSGKRSSKSKYQFLNTESSTNINSTLYKKDIKGSKNIDMNLNYNEFVSLQSDQEKNIDAGISPLRKSNEIQNNVNKEKNEEMRHSDIKNDKVANFIPNDIDEFTCHSSSHTLMNSVENATKSKMNQNIRRKQFHTVGKKPKLPIRNFALDIAKINEDVARVNLRAGNRKSIDLSESGTFLAKGWKINPSGIARTPGTNNRMCKSRMTSGTKCSTDSISESNVLHGTSLTSNPQQLVKLSENIIKNDFINSTQNKNITNVKTSDGISKNDVQQNTNLHVDSSEDFSIGINTSHNSHEKSNQKLNKCDIRYSKLNRACTTTVGKCTEEINNIGDMYDNNSSIHKMYESEEKTQKPHSNLETDFVKYLEHQKNESSQSASAAVAAVAATALRPNPKKSYKNLISNSKQNSNIDSNTIHEDDVWTSSEAFFHSKSRPYCPDISNSIHDEIYLNSQNHKNNENGLNTCIKNELNNDLLMNTSMKRNDTQQGISITNHPNSTVKKNEEYQKNKKYTQMSQHDQPMKTDQNEVTMKQKFNHFQQRDKTLLRQKYSQDERNSKYSKDERSMRAEFIVLKELGRGAGGVVYKAVHVPTLHIVAIKKVRMSSYEKKKQILRELGSLFANSIDLGDWSSLPPCPQIVTFHGAFTSAENQSMSIVLEYMDAGTLQDFVSAGKPCSEPILANVTLRVIKGLQFIHSLRQIHRDIKPANLLINSKGAVKIADFGISREFDETNFSNAVTFTGTLIYMSPERLAGKPYSYDADIWSLGLTVFTLAQAKFPLEAASGGFWELASIIKEKKVPQLDSEKYSPELVDFCAKCLKKNPKERPSAEELLSHPFLTEATLDVPNRKLPQTISLQEKSTRDLEKIAKKVASHSHRMLKRNTRIKSAPSRSTHSSLDGKSFTSKNKSENISKYYKESKYHRRRSRNLSPEFIVSKTNLASTMPSNEIIKGLASQLNIPAELAIRCFRKHFEDLQKPKLCLPKVELPL